MVIIRKLEIYKPTIFKAEQSYYDKDAADMAVNFISYLKHTKGEWFGKNFDLIDWQEQIIRDVFGTMKPNGYRQFNTAYIEIAKKQGKSELAAAVALLLTCGDFMDVLRIGNKHRLYLTLQLIWWNNHPHLKHDLNQSFHKND